MLLKCIIYRSITCHFTFITNYLLSCRHPCHCSHLQSKGLISLCCVLVFVLNEQLSAAVLRGRNKQLKYHRITSIYACMCNWLNWILYSQSIARHMNNVKLENAVGCHWLKILVFLLATLISVHLNQITRVTWPEIRNWFAPLGMLIRKCLRPATGLTSFDTFTPFTFFFTWSLTLRKEHWLSVFENRVLRRIFGPRRDGLTGEWTKLHNEELNDL